MREIIIVGCGGHAKSVVDAIERQNVYTPIGFIGKERDKEFCHQGLGVLGTDEDLEKLYRSGIRDVFVGIGYLGHGRIRNDLYRKLLSIGFTLCTIVDPSATVSGTAQMGQGVFVGKGAVINADAMIGDFAIINTRTIVEHDCRISDFSHIAVGAILCGNVRIGESTFIGAGSTIIENIVIGDNVIVGAGAVVTKDIPADNEVVGVPARIIKRWETE